MPQLVKNYTPTSDVLKHISKVELLMIIGPSGVGKTSIIDRLGLKYVPSDTTRLARPEEINGLDMYFLTSYDQVIADIKAGIFVQLLVGASGDFYGTRATSYPADGWAVMPVLADVVPIFRNLGFKRTISTFITPPSYEEWMRRLGSHKLSTEQLRKRLVEAQRSHEFAIKDNQIHFILNDDLSKAVEQTKALIDGRVDAAREELAKFTAKKNLSMLIQSL